MLNRVAWILATSSQATLRDAEKAVQLATRACELTQWQVPGLLDTLAAAHAEGGRFEEAVRLLEQVLQLPADGHVEEYQARIKLYRDGLAYRTP
jgi:serine/threonine-protein kinase